MVYQPREDTWLILNCVKSFFDRDRDISLALDMGTGSGIVAQELSKNCKQVIAVDIDPQAIEFSKKQVKAKNVRFIVSDLFEKINDKFDLIVFNPPYLPPEPQPKTSTGPFKVSEWAGGRPLILKFLKQAQDRLTPAGSIILLFSSRTGLELSELQNLGFKLSKLDETKFFYESLWVYQLVFQ